MYPAKIFLTIIFLLGTCKENAIDATQSVKLLIGETPVNLNVYRRGESGKIVYVNMHDDENTAVEAIKTFLADKDGYFVELKAQGNRFVSFRLNQSEYKFDPNRIFTNAGIEKTTAPSGEIQRFVDTLFTFLFLKDVRTIVALHNNSEGSFSAQSYAVGSDQANMTTCALNRCAGDYVAASTASFKQNIISRRRDDS